MKLLGFACALGLLAAYLVLFVPEGSASRLDLFVLGLLVALPSSIASGPFLKLIQRWKRHRHAATYLRDLLAAQKSESPPAIPRGRVPHAVDHFLETGVVPALITAAG